MEMLKISLVSFVVLGGSLLAGLATYGRSQEPATVDRESQTEKAPVSAQGVSFTGDESKPKTEDGWVVFRLRSHSSESVARSLEQTLGPETKLKIVFDKKSNSLFVRGPAEALKQCEELLEAIDQPPSVIDFEIVLSVSDSATGDDENSKPRKTNRIRFSTLNENLASIQLGQRVAVTSGVIAQVNGPPARSLEWPEVGTSCEVHPRIVGNTILVQLKIENFWLADAAAGDVADAASPGISTATLNSTLVLKSGVAHTVLANATQGSNASENVSITITATPVQVQGH
jgi:type II secretory pathway component GspD/PulD (secretin)